jgi:beta-galactosidase
VLYFAELYQQAEGTRSFNVLVENKTILSELDLFKKVGRDTAWQYTTENVAVTDGTLSIALDTILDNATISGMAIFSKDGGKLAVTPQNAMPNLNANQYDGARDTTINFDADWKFNLGDSSGAQNTAFNDSAWSSINVPHDWSISLPFNEKSLAAHGGGFLDGGTGWYRKTFLLPATAAGQKLFIQFDGIYMDSTVWLNGQQICARPYGYTSFECDITAAAKVGASNLLAVKVNNLQPTSRWYSGSGIYRHVWLKTVNPIYVGFMGTFVKTPNVSASSASVEINVNVQNQTGSTQIVTARNVIFDARGTEVESGTIESTSIATNANKDIKQTLIVSNPAPWSPDSPSLYSVVTTLMVNGSAVDTYTTVFGIRQFELNANTGFWLNGKQLKINGVCLHHDLGPLGAAVNTRAITKRLEMLKQMGANAIRTSHNPPAPELLDLADKMGFLVMDEAFDMWYGAKSANDYARFFNEWSERDIKDMVRRDRNHASVIMWSIGNEIPQASDQNAAKRLIGFVRSLDTTRLVGQAFAQWNYDAAAEATAGLVDFVGLNYNPGIYDAQHIKYPARKFIGSETSSAVRSRGIYNNNNLQLSSYDNAIVGWGQTAENSWRDVNTREWIAGEFIWTGFDYIGEPTPNEAWPAKSSYFGAIDTANFPKDIFYFYQSRWNWNGPTMVHMVPMNWTNWTVGQAVKVMVYSNAESVELFLNGTSLGSKAVAQSLGHIEWSVPFAKGTLEARARKGGKIVATDTLRTANAAAKIGVSADRSSINADGNDLAFIEVDILDAQVTLVPNASNLVNFTIEGPGVLVGVDNGNAISLESYKGKSRSAFSGKVMAIVQSTKTAGTITLKVTSAGLTASEVKINTTR